MAVCSERVPVEETCWAMYKRGWVRHMWVRTIGGKEARSACGCYPGVAETELVDNPEAAKCKGCVEIDKKWRLLDALLS